MVTAAEIFHAKVTMEPNQDEHELRKYVGRAKGATFVIKDRMKEPRKNKGLPANACSPMVQWWAVLTSRLGLLNKLKKRKPKIGQVEELYSDLIDSVTGLPEGQNEKYYATCFKQVVPAREQWRKALLGVREKSEKDLEKMEEDANEEGT